MGRGGVSWQGRGRLEEAGQRRRQAGWTIARQAGRTVAMTQQGKAAVGVPPAAAAAGCTPPHHCTRCAAARSLQRAAPWHERTMAIISSRSLLSITDCMFFLGPSTSVVCKKAAAPPSRPSRRALFTSADPTLSPLLRALPLCLPMAGSRSRRAGGFPAAAGRAEAGGGGVGGSRGRQLGRFQAAVCHFVSLAHPCGTRGARQEAAQRCSAEAVGGGGRWSALHSPSSICLPGCACPKAAGEAGSTPRAVATGAGLVSGSPGCSNNL